MLPHRLIDSLNHNGKQNLELWKFKMEDSRHSKNRNVLAVKITNFQKYKIADNCHFENS